MPYRYLAGLDIGFVEDPTALLVVRAESQPAGTHYIPLFLQRLPLPCTAPDVLALVQSQLGPGTPWRRGRDVLAVDITGCGTPIWHEIARLRLDPLGVWSHGGIGENRVEGRWHVGKQTLVNAAKLVVEQHRFKLDPALPLAEVMLHELASYRGFQRQTTGNITYAAWREKDHDDLVFCLAMVAWWGELLARSVPADVDLSTNLQGMQTPRTWSDPQATVRPRVGRLRIFADTYAEHPAFDARAWDEAKRAMAEGRQASRSPHAP